MTLDLKFIWKQIRSLNQTGTLNTDYFIDLMFFGAHYLQTQISHQSWTNQPNDRSIRTRQAALQIVPDSTSWCSLKRRSFKSLKSRQSTLLPLRGKKGYLRHLYWRVWEVCEGSLEARFYESQWEIDIVASV